MTISFPSRLGKADALPLRSGALSRGRAACAVALLLVFCTLAVSPAPAWAKKKVKESRTVTGVVLDASENPIVGATVELTDKQSGKKTAIYSKEEGRYSFAGLDPYHDYELQALSKNLTSEQRQVSSLDDRDKIYVILRVPPPKE